MPNQPHNDAFAAADAAPYATDESDEYVSGEDYREELIQMTPATHTFGWRQKVAVVFLALFGVSAVVLWGMQFQNNLGGREPVATTPATSAQAQENERLRNQDTDQDGLNDYEELQFYQTSPYIQDSDSDGATDFEEVQAGDDPNCPRGTDCSGAVPASPTIPVSNRGVEQNAGTSLQAALGEGGEGSEALRAILSGEADPSRLRTLLIEAGMNEDTLSSFTDEQLLEVYTNTLESYQ